MKDIAFCDWGIVRYADAYERQHREFERALQDKAEGRKPQNQVFFCEHPHVITIGKNGLYSNLLFPEKILSEKGVELYQVDRGGDVTYHGYGQVVVYPIIDLEQFGIGLKEYIFRLEETIIQTLTSFYIQCGRLAKATGVWIDSDNTQKTRKIAAIGVRSSRYVTMHGLALNVNTDLNYFRLINPCGFIDKGVTSMRAELGREIDIVEVKNILQRKFEEMFG